MNRDKKVIINMLLSVGIKGFGIILTLFLMPAYMNYFQNQHALGLWFTLLSVLNWILTFDFGIGNGLRNYLAIAIAKNEMRKEKILISTTYWISIQIAFVFFIICNTAVIFVDWNSVFNVSSNIISENALRKAIFIILVSIILQFVLKTITSILLARQLPSISNILGFISNLIILIAILILKTVDDETNLISLSYIYLVATNLPLVFATVIMFSTFLKGSRPSLKMVDKSVGISIIKIGGGFFALQILSLMLFNMKEFLISWTSGPSDVVEFQVYNRLFGFITAIAWIALTPIWSAVTEAYAKKEYSWINSIYSRLKKLMVLITLVMTLLILNLNIIVDYWLGKNAIEIKTMYSIAFGISCLLYIWWGVLASFANGVGKIKNQMLMSILGVIINLSMSVILVNLFNSWIAVIYANIISMLPYCMVEPRKIRKIFNGGNHESSQ